MANLESERTLCSLFQTKLNYFGFVYPCLSSLCNFGAGKGNVRLVFPLVLKELILLKFPCYRSLPPVTDRKIIRGNITRVICPAPLLPPFHYLAFLRFPRIRSWLPGNVVEPQSSLNFKRIFEWLTPAKKSELTNRY